MAVALLACVGRAQAVPDPAAKDRVCDPAPALASGLASADWAGIRAAYEAGRHAVQPFGAGYRTHNPGQRWMTCFDGRGFVTMPDVGAWSWGLDLVRYGWGELGRELGEADLPQCVESSGTRLEYEWDERLSEWYVNDARGLEHGFTVHERPAGTSGQLAFELAVRGDLEPVVEASGRDVSFLDAGGQTVLNYSGLEVFDADSHSVPASFERKGERLVLCVEEREARYPLTIDPVAQQAYLKAFNPDQYDGFGWRVAVSTDTVVVAAYSEDGGSTEVNGDPSDNSRPTAGAVYVFVREGEDWRQQAYIKATNTDADDWFGYSVAISGDTIVVGAIYEDSSATGVNGDGTDNSAKNSGAAYVYVRNGTTWSRQAYLKASNTGGAFPGSEEGDVFGASVSISEDTIAVGAPEEDSDATGIDGDQHNDNALGSGAVYVFRRNGGSWSQQAYVKASNTEYADKFGYAVSIASDTLLVGAGGEDDVMPNSGAAYVFTRVGATWNQMVYLKASNPGNGDGFGFPVALSEDIAVIGAVYEDSDATGVDGDGANDNAHDSGAAYVFVRNGSTWSQRAYMKASNTGPNDHFGGSVAVSGDTVVVSASGEDSAGRGVNADGDNEDASNSGAAYLFRRTGTTWSQSAYLKSSNSEAEDAFGVSVAVDGDWLFIGASGEDSSASHPNGDQNNNSRTNSGAAYVFVLIPEPTALCFGDGSGAPCPCGNPGGSGRGCANSTGAGGLLTATGSAYVHAHDLVLSGTDLVPNQPGLYFQGQQALAGGAGIPFGDGLRCAGGGAIRLEIRLADAGGASSTTLDLAAEGRVHPGDTRFYQLYYRDTASSPCGSGFDLTNAIQVRWVE